MGSMPPTLYILVTSKASWLVMEGRIVGIARASKVFPPPGGPTKSRLWAPAAATSKARLAWSCPRTLPMSTSAPPEVS